MMEALERAGKELTRDKLSAALEGFESWRGAGPHMKGPGMGPPITLSKTQRLGSDKIFLVKASGGKWEKLTDWLGPDGPDADQPGADQPGADGPGADGPGADGPVADRPGAGGGSQTKPAAGSE
jgi:hypothetical protein